MTHAQHSRVCALYRRESRRGTRDMPLRSFDPAGNLVLRFPARAYTITPEGKLA